MTKEEDVMIPGILMMLFYSKVFIQTLATINDVILFIAMKIGISTRRNNAEIIVIIMNLISNKKNLEAIPYIGECVKIAIYRCIEGILLISLSLHYPIMSFIIEK